MSKSIAGPPHKPTSPPHRDPHWSEDGRWHWDGKQWLSMTSADGKWLWDGSNWVPDSPSVPPPSPPLTKPKGLENPFNVVALLIVLVTFALAIVALSNDSQFQNWLSHPGQNVSPSASTSYLHYSCGTISQCAHANGAWTGIRGKFASESACLAAGPRIGFTPQEVSGGPGWWCDDNPSPKEP